MSWGGHDKAWQARDFKQQKCILSQFRGQKSEVKVRAGVVAFEASFLTTRCLPSPCVFTSSCLWACLCPHLLLLEGHSHIGLGPTLRTSLESNYLCPSTVTFRSRQHVNLGRPMSPFDGSSAGISGSGATVCPPPFCFSNRLFLTNATRPAFSEPALPCP